MVEATKTALIAKGAPAERIQHDETVPRLMRTSFLGKVHVMPSKYDPETRAKAVRLVLEHRDD